MGEEAARDFLLQISSLNNHHHHSSTQIKPDRPLPPSEDTAEEIELSLGLSLNGCFGVDPHKKTNLIRSSSIASFPSLVAAAATAANTEHDRPAAVPGSITRTSSLPAEEIQVLKRLEAKRKRLERRNSINKNGGVRGECSVERCDEDAAEMKRRRVEGTSSEVCNGSTGRVEFGSAIAAVTTALKSQGSTSSFDLSAAGVKSMQGETESDLSNFSDQRSSGMFEASTNHQTPAASPMPATKVPLIPNPIRKISGRAHSFSVVERNMLQEMPCVSTKGEGPNGKRIEGFLYRYKKGDEVRIVCVCHGRFLTPAEFVRHAGGGDVAHPLRHIVVSASPSACV